MVGYKGRVSFNSRMKELILTLQDMPFCESGLVPDIIFNPHGYPSRMTIGMMLESMAGKSVSMNGRPEDASPFSSAFDESRPAHEYHGNLLRQAGKRPSWY